MTKLPPCPIEGCKSESDHHCHWSEATPWVEDRTRITGCACDASSEYVTVCYSRPIALMLSVETVAKMIEAAETAAYERGLWSGYETGYRRGWDKGWAEIWKNGESELRYVG